MRGDAYITVTCDKCGVDEEVQLTSIARGGYDERDVDSHLESLRWNVDDGDVCPDCKVA